MDFSSYNVTPLCELTPVQLKNSCFKEEPNLVGSILVRTQFGGFHILHLIHLSLDNKNVIKRVYSSIFIGIKCLETKKKKQHMIPVN